MTATAITFEAMTEAHLDGALALSVQAGWPHRREDWQMSLGLSQGIVGLDGGRVVATILMTPYGADGATINLVIVAPELRGMGLGRRMMDSALALAGSRICYLVATEIGLPLYEKTGFVATGKTVQHQGEVLPVAGPPGIGWADAADHAALVALDAAAFGHDRTGLMQVLRGMARFAVIRGEGQVQAFAAIRPFGRGQVIGPVVARDADAARGLIDFLLAQNTGRFVRLDTDLAVGLTSWLAERGLVRTGTGAAMTRLPDGVQRAPKGTHRIFGLVSQAFG